jgi:septum formation protein
MLKSLSNKTHQVITGYAIVTKDQIINDYDVSEVTFNLLSDELIKQYIKTGSPMDKAGAYGIQDGFPLLRKLKGSLNNVIGLPIEKIKSVLQNALVF